MEVDKKKYEEYVKEITPVHSLPKSMACAFLVGGVICLIGQLITNYLMKGMGMEQETASAWNLLALILISIILTGNMFRDIYEKKGYESCLLSRTTEDSVTVTSVLIPWNTCGMTQATILSVPTLVYLPYCFFNIISPLMSITIAAIGYKIVRRK